MRQSKQADEVLVLALTWRCFQTAVCVLGLSLMAHSQDRNAALIDTITRHIAAVPKRDQPFTILIRQIIDRSAHPGMQTEGLNALQDSSAGALSGRWVSWAKKCAQPLNITERGGCENYG
jgi:hypothetical protein